jgi:type II secretory pathway pseudopilin PulG
MTPRAFTLLETVAVLVLILVLAGLAIPTYRAVIGETREDAAVVSAKAFAKSIDAYAASQNVAPSELDADLLETHDPRDPAGEGLLAAELPLNTTAATDAGTVTLCLIAGSTAKCSLITLATSVGGRSSVTPTNAAPAFALTGPVAIVYAPGDGTIISTTLLAVDGDGDDLTWTLLGGADAALFTLDADDGTLRSSSGLDHADPLDANTDNVYELTVSVADGIAAAILDVYLDVLEVRARSVAVGALNVEAVSVSLPATPTFSLAGGPDESVFAVDPASGLLSFTAPATTNGDADANGIYEVWVLATVGADSQRIVYRVTVGG